MRATDEKRVPLGRVSGAYGIKGWIKVQSYTEPPENIVQFRDWILERRGAEQHVRVETGKARGTTVLVKLEGVGDRDAAEALGGATVAVERAALPPCAPGEFYWADLEGLSVRTPAGEVLGVIDHLVATPAHEVMVLAGEPARLIPFVAGRIVQRVDLDEGVVIVDWDASYWD